MISEKMLALGQKRSVIREIFEYAKARAAVIGVENIFDFSIGNPSIPPPPAIKNSIIRLLEREDPAGLHGYTSAPGDLAVRRTIADSLNRRFDVDVRAEDLYMTVGAAASLSISLNALLLPGEEVIVFAPYFPEYKVFIEAAGGVMTPVTVDPTDFQLDFDALSAAIKPETKAVIVNSPNNPSGAVLTEQTVIRLCRLLTEKSAVYGHPIYLIADEPYRELVYGEIQVPYLPNYYDYVIICYSYSKSFSLPGERIGYILVCNRMAGAAELYAAICGAGRALGYVCAPSLFQKVVAECVDEPTDVSAYRKNRDLLYDGLTKLGYQCVHPDGAFYLFVKAMEPDANAFCEKAKKHELLLVPSDDFGMPSYVRIAYCVKPEMIVKSLPAFAKLAQEYQK